MSTSLIIAFADYSTGKAQQTTITGVNPKAANADLQTFAQMTAALSKDTYVKAERVDKLGLDSGLKTPHPVTRWQAILQGGETVTIEDGVLNITTAQVRTNKPANYRPWIDFTLTTPTGGGVIPINSVIDKDFVDDCYFSGNRTANSTSCSSSLLIGEAGQDPFPGRIVTQFEFLESELYAPAIYTLTINITEGA